MTKYAIFSAIVSRYSLYFPTIVIHAFLPRFLFEILTLHPELLTKTPFFYHDPLTNVVFFTTIPLTKFVFSFRDYSMKICIFLLIFGWNLGVLSEIFWRNSYFYCDSLTKFIFFCNQLTDFISFLHAQLLKFATVCRSLKFAKIFRDR